MMSMFAGSVLYKKRSGGQRKVSGYRVKSFGCYGIIICWLLNMRMCWLGAEDRVLRSRGRGIWGGLGCLKKYQ